MGSQKQGTVQNNCGRREQIQRAQAIKVLQQKYGESLSNFQQRFSSLYRETVIQLCDRSTLHILKWIETYEISWRSLNRENTKERRGLIQVIKIIWEQGQD